MEFKVFERLWWATPVWECPVTDIDNKAIADNDWINLTILRSKGTGKRYIEVDTYKKPVTTPAQTLSSLPEVKVDLGEVNIEDVHFN